MPAASGTCAQKSLSWAHHGQTLTLPAQRPPIQAGVCRLDQWGEGLTGVAVVLYSPQPAQANGRVNTAVVQCKWHLVVHTFCLYQLTDKHRQTFRRVSIGKPRACSKVGRKRMSS